MSVRDAREASDNRLFTLPVARAIGAQLIEGISFLHGQGVVHGDLHEGNILFRTPLTASDSTSDDFYRTYGQPDFQLVKRIDGKERGPGVPRHVITPIWLGKASEDNTLTEANIFLSDFGESFQPAKERHVITRTHLSY
ncbi:MAG: hypothetical protein CYPHOPRED_001295 [Cyphobasidiales sp. Tagirdzhanova-0007]|nr:MAG: hypothetical protein CYPHOPRED_001295 [Cyphobasidiales sp. Tagirdzhanova-0007]